jgi:hypothetical protein
VKKKDATLRLCINFRQPNKVTIKKKYPLPRIDDLFDHTKGVKIFSKINLRLFYHQVRITKEYINKTTFRIRYKHYEFTVVPFGISIAPIVFMCLINGVFTEYIDKFVIVFLDDILIYSKLEEKHEKHLRMVLKFLGEHKLHAKLSKCIFYQNKIHYLGHIISADGIVVHLEKIEAIRGWLVLRNFREVKSFMGLSSYYQIFIKGFSKISRPITSLQNKGVKFEWTFVCEEIFQQLKDILTSASVLKIENLDEDFVVCIDVCKEGLGGVLIQKDHVVYYESRKLKEHERNNAAHDLELASIVHTLKNVETLPQRKEI